MILKIICVILAVSTIGFGLISYSLLKKFGHLVKAYSEFTCKMATLIEFTTVNDHMKYSSDKKELGFQVIESFEGLRQYYKKIPPQISLMLKAIRNKYGERPQYGEKPHGLTIHT